MSVWVELQKLWLHLKKCVERSHVPEITLIETFAKLGCKAFSQFGEQAPAIGGAGGSTLLEFDDVLPDSPAGLNLHYIHGMQDLLAGGLDHFAKTGKETADVVSIHSHEIG